MLVIIELINLFLGLVGAAAILVVATIVYSMWTNWRVDDSHEEKL